MSDNGATEGAPPGKPISDVTAKLDALERRFDDLLARVRAEENIRRIVREEIEIARKQPLGTRFAVGADFTHVDRARIDEAKIGGVGRSPAPQVDYSSIGAVGATQRLRLECLRVAIESAKVVPAQGRTSIFEIARRVERYVTGMTSEGDADA